jgi:hypothetical protein
LSKDVCALSIATDEESSLVSYKRVASTNLSYSIKRALVSSIYEEITLQELRNFLLNYKIYFDVVEEYKDYIRNRRALPRPSRQEEISVYMALL